MQPWARVVCVILVIALLGGALLAAINAVTNAW